MYCNPPDKPEFSYGLVITDVDEKSMTFKARSAILGRYEVADGRIEVDDEFGRQHVHIRYTEVWPNGMRDELFARLKSNKKFQCESDSGFVQKARHEETMPVAERYMREDMKKYYIGEQDAYQDQF